mmetsp:Transcript_26045/g.76158  ORF Transcript_26045/g.76158 Transcript_26045/m.76158 type:complete len:137 (+) Transcript_26045:118-528(+)
MAKVSISSLVVVGKKEILKSGKLYDESVDVQVVIKSAMDKAAAQAERSLCFVKAEAFASDFAMERRGTELDTDDLPDVTVKHLRDHFGIQPARPPGAHRGGATGRRQARLGLCLSLNLARQRQEHGLGQAQLQRQG